jgi:hypothetical protein
VEGEEAMRKHLCHCLVSVFLLLTLPYLFLSVESPVAYAATYDVTITALDDQEGGTAVLITMDGVPTGFTTAHTFTGLTGTHSFTVPITDSYGNAFGFWSTRWKNPTINVGSGGTYVAYYYPVGMAPHDVTINAWEATRESSESVSISVDGAAAEFNTPHTFEDVVGTHDFTVPSSDSFGVPFGNWQETGWTGTTITVGGEGGTFTARYYYQPYNATILGWDSVYGGMSEAVSMDGSFAGIIPLTFTDLTGPHSFTLPATNSYGHLFTEWDSGETSTTINVILNGTHTAYYAPAPTPTPSPSPSPSPTPPPTPTSSPTQAPTPSPTPTSSSPTPNPTPSSQPTPTPTPTKTPGPTAKPSSTPGPTEAAAFVLPVESFFVIGIIAIVVIVAAVILIRKKKQKEENKIV